MIQTANCLLKISALHLGRLPFIYDYMHMEFDLIHDCAYEFWVENLLKMTIKQWEHHEIWKQIIEMSHEHFTGTVLSGVTNYTPDYYVYRWNNCKLVIKPESLKCGVDSLGENAPKVLNYNFYNWIHVTGAKSNIKIEVIFCMCAERKSRKLVLLWKCMVCAEHTYYYKRWATV